MEAIIAKDAPMRRASNPDPSYALRHGSVYLVRETGAGGDVLPKEEILAEIRGNLSILYEKDGGTLLKHGDESKVGAHFEKVRQAGLGDGLHLLTIPRDVLTEDVLVAVNRRLHASGTLARLPAELEALASTEVAPTR